MSVGEELRWHWVAGIVARYVWDDHSWDVLSDRHVRLARSVGALSELPVALNSRAFMLLFAGERAAAASLIQQLQPAIEATGSDRVPYSALGLAVFAGRQADAATMIDAITRDVSLRGEGIGLTINEWASALLNNGLGNYEKAVTAVERATDYLGGNDHAALAGGRAHRGGHAEWAQRYGRRCPPPASRNHHDQRHGLGARDRSSFTCAAD
jgi:hypothetical protein